jgi:DNA-binding CsgD family transcriptional regulator
MTELIDRIYECAVVPELWPSVLDDLAELTDARGGLLFSARKQLCWTASESVQDIFQEYFTDGWFDRCSRRVCSMNNARASFFVEQDFWDKDQLEKDPMYRDLFRPHGLGWSTWTGLRMPTGDEIVVSIERTFERGPIEREHVDRLNELRPHLVRAALVTARLGLQRAKGATDALTALGLPALLVDETGRVVEANPLIEALPEKVRFGVNNRLILADAKANETLASALAQIETLPSAASRTFALRDEAGQATTLLHIMPIRRSAHDVLGRSYALVLLTPLDANRGAPSADLMRTLFDLTPSEARVAQGIAGGKSMEDIASQGGVAITTVRSQLRRVLEKTGCTRQAEVAALLARVTIGAR